MLLPFLSAASALRLLRRFRRDREGTTAVEFAFIAPIFFAMLFALFETALFFFAGQVLENGVQDSGRLIYTARAQDNSMTQAQFRADLCPRLVELFTCSGVTFDVQSYAAGTAIPATVPYDSNGNATTTMNWNLPAANSTSTVVVRAFYQWPLFVTQLGYNIANINRGASNSKRLMVATAAFRVEPR